MEGDFFSNYKLCVDDIKVGVGSIGVNNSNLILLGDSGSHGVGEAQILYFSFMQPSAIPEPIPLALVLSGLAALFLRFSPRRAQ